MGSALLTFYVLVRGGASMPQIFYNLIYQVQK
jgi:hypothetical protein